MSPLAWIALVLSQAPLFSQGHGPVRTGKPASELSAQECQPCHERVYAEWSRSRHALAWSNSLFTESFRDNRSAWCVHCHAPLVEKPAQALTGRSPAPELLSEGVNCASCHIRDGELLTGRAPSKDALQAHPIRQEPRLSSSEFCGGCHEFFMPDFRTPGHPDSPLPMQKTLTEWRASGAARREQTCQSCHMPGGAHAFPGAHDLDLVRRTLGVEWLRQGPARLCAVVRARDVAHAVPTGDPFRRMRLRLCRDSACEQPVGQRLLMRKVEWTGETATEGTDTRLASPSSSDTSERTECFQLSPDRMPSYWMLEILYAEPKVEARLPDSDTRAIVTSGELPTRAADMKHGI